MGSNIPGKKRALLLYANSAPAYREKCAEVAANGTRASCSNKPSFAAPFSWAERFVAQLSRSLFPEQI